VHDQTVCECRFTVVDVGDDAEVSDVLQGVNLPFKLT
jgi:hypothetical protein